MALLLSLEIKIKYDNEKWNAVPVIWCRNSTCSLAGCQANYLTPAVWLTLSTKEENI